MSMLSRLSRNLLCVRRASTNVGAVAKIDPPLRCTIFNEKGKVTQVAASIDRRKFIRDYGLHSRDLRHVEGNQQASLVPYIILHRGSLLVNICDIRVLIRNDQVLVFHSRDPAIAERLSMLVYEFSAKLARSSQSVFYDRRQTYEQTALETVLVQAIAYLEVELRLMLDGLNGILQELETRVDRELLKDLLVRSKSLQQFHRKCLAVRNALDDALEDVPEFQHLSSPSSAEVTQQKRDYNDIELLLETYYREADELVQKAGKTVRDVSTTEEIINIMIDANRNSLLLFRIEISVLTVAFTIAMFLAGLYGMNLENFIDETDWGMTAVTVSIVLLCAASAIYNFRKLRRTEKVFFSSRVPKHDVEMSRWLQSAKQSPSSRNL